MVKELGYIFRGDDMIIESEVLGLDTALRQAGLPMTVVPSDLKSNKELGKKLGRARVGSGHDCYLKGIMVNLEITATLKWFDQFDRYSFQDTISSTSQMHRLDQFDLGEQFSEYTDENIIAIVKELQSEYRESPSELNYYKLLHSVPQGFLYTRGITTNYLQLKTMYYQRRNHKLAEWREFCQHLEALPMFMELIGEEKECNHPDIEYQDINEMRSRNMYCKVCGKQGSRDELKGEI